MNEVEMAGHKGIVAETSSSDLLQNREQEVDEEVCGDCGCEELQDVKIRKPARLAFRKASLKAAFGEEARSDILTRAVRKMRCA
jgi:hypothetical protein